MNKIKRKLMVIGLCLSFIILTGCEVKPIEDPDIPIDTHPFIGTYTLERHSINDIDITDQYVFSTLTITEDEAIMSSVDLFGLNEQRGTYSYNEEEVKVLIGIRTYLFRYNKQEKSLTYQGRISRKDVNMTYIKQEFKKPDTKGGVNFTKMLFGEDLSQNFYNYAPTIMMEGNSIMHIWYCANKDSGYVKDYIAYRKGELLADGTWSFSGRKLVLEPTSGTWDEVHACDPSVIKGEFNYNNETYHYLMSYLGCITNDSSRNEVGIAVAKNVEGPWVKVDSINPIANYYQSNDYVNDRWTWGYGQPSLLSVDEKGQILLFYTKGVVRGTFQYVEHWDLSNLNNPKKLHEAEITNAGVVNSSSATDVINNADFAYDKVNHRLYVIKEDFPYPSDGKLNWLTGSNTVMYLNLNENDSFLGETLFTTPNLRWQVVSSIGKNETGHARVHNVGIVTNEYGYLKNPFQIPIIYTASDLVTDYPNWNASGQWPALHTYRLHGYLLEP